MPSSASLDAFDPSSIPRIRALGSKGDAYTAGRGARSIRESDWNPDARTQH
jgi:hypothetical protein